MADETAPNRKRKRERKPGVFTDRYIKSLKPEAEMYQVREGRGFAIRVLPSGAKTWYYIYDFGGKRRQLNLGNYPDKSLEAAHDDYRKAVELVKKGIDPMAPPPAPQPEPAKKEALTVSGLKALYVKHIKGHLVARSVVQQERTLDKDVVPVIGDLPAAEIRRKDAIALVETVARRAPGQARNVIKTARSMYSFALARELVELNPFAGAGRAVPVTAPKARKRVLSDDEIRKVWASLKDDEIGRATLLILTTGQRPGEVTGLHRDEIDGRWWTIPPERAKKNDRENRVYLTGLSKSLLALPARDYDHVFPARGRGRGIGADGSMRPATLSHNLTDNDYFGLPRWTPHDLRRTMATGLARLGCPDEVIDEVLNHKKKGIISVYNRHRYDREKRRWLILWARHLRKTVKAKSE